MDIHVYVHVLNDAVSEKFTILGSKLDAALSLLQELKTKEETMAGELTALQAQVAKNTDVEASAVTLLQGLKTALDAAIASGDPTALTALSTQLGTSADALAAAIVANTPAG